jgi:hypothetical protein
MVSQSPQTVSGQFKVAASVFADREDGSSGRPTECLAAFRVSLRDPKTPRL